MIRVTLKAGLISFVVFAMLAGASPMAAAGASPKAAGGLGAAAGFAVLADGTGLTCTHSNVTGSVGVSSSTTAVTQTGCTINVQVAPGAYADFRTAYNVGLSACTRTFTAADTLAGLTLGSGVYCFPAAATLTGTLTLTGAGPWLFQVGTGGTGALTATNFAVVGGNPCNATWWVRQDVTLSTSAFQGTILGGGDITLTDTSLAGRALATGAVTMTRSPIFGCTAGGTVAKPHGPIGKGELNRAACNAVGKAVIDVNQKVLNDVDSGTDGNNWAFDTYNRHIQVWQTGATTWCAVVTYNGGKFAAIAGEASPGIAANTIGAKVKGEFSGGYRATFAGTLLATPLWRTHGNVGTVDYMCNSDPACPGYVDWVAQYFTYSNFDMVWWGWSYHASGHHGTWVNSSDGNSGDVF